MSDAAAIIRGRIGYEFTTCFRGSELLFKKIMQGYGGASRYGFKLYLNLKQNREQGIFELSDDNPIEYMFLGQFNNPVLEDIIPAGDKGVALDSIEDLFNTFRVKPVIVSVIINYGPGIDINHQAGLFKLDNDLLFYEPYGCYKKYGMDYSACILAALSVFSRYRLNTYHHHFGLRYGLQEAMIVQGKRKKVQFDKEYHRVKEEAGVPASEKLRYEDDESDATFASMTLMSRLNNTGLPVIRSAAQLFGKYSAKLCVSIFLVECTLFLKHRNDLATEYQALDFNDPEGNTSTKVLKKLHSIMYRLYGKKMRYFDSLFLDISNDTTELCRKLTRP